MLAADIAVADTARLIDRELKRLFRVRRQIQTRIRRSRLGCGPQFRHFFRARHIHSQVAQDATGHAALLPHQSQKQMLRVY